MSGQVSVRVIGKKIEFEGGVKALEQACPNMVAAIKEKYQKDSQETITNVVLGVFTMIALPQIQEDQALSDRVTVLDFSRYESTTQICLNQE